MSAHYVNQGHVDRSWAIKNKWKIKRYIYFLKIFQRIVILSVKCVTWFDIKNGQSNIPWYMRHCTCVFNYTQRTAVHTLLVSREGLQARLCTGSPAEDHFGSVERLLRSGLALFLLERKRDQDALSDPVVLPQNLLLGFWFLPEGSEPDQAAVPSRTRFSSPAHGSPFTHLWFSQPHFGMSFIQFTTEHETWFLSFFAIESNESTNLDKIYNYWRSKNWRQNQVKLKFPSRRLTLILVSLSKYFYSQIIIIERTFKRQFMKSTSTNSKWCMI